ncbi:Vinorine synthase [Corchorus olitorius]|uniref:Vinorine synthase n=1 Tax=Corchorus olitorius TaxID=93759 RepID=A0A1R3J0E0_9ROSI|nr:Vinorine synthase [Corchorus olitorius]
MSNGCGVAVDVVSKGIEESSISSLAKNVGVAAAEEQGIMEREIPVYPNFRKKKEERSTFKRYPKMIAGNNA